MSIDERIQQGNAIQLLGTISLITGIIRAIITVYLNIMAKQNVNHYGHNISASGNAQVATDEAVIASDFAVVNASEDIKISGNTDDAMMVVITRIEKLIDKLEINLPAKRKSRSIMGKIEEEVAKPVDLSKSLLDVISKAGGATTSVVDAIKSIEGLF